MTGTQAYAPARVPVPPGGATAPAIDVQRLPFSYGKREALKRRSTSRSRDAAVTAIIGPSGCGKSTFLRSINRLNDLIPGTRHEGDILVRRARRSSRRHRPGRAPPAGRHGVPAAESVPQDDLTRTWPTARRSTRLVADARPARPGGALPPAGGALGRGEGPARVARPPASPAASSSGSASRVPSATSPEVLLMDEPCSALDPIATQRVEELIVELKARVHHRHRHAQHAAGGARVRRHRDSSTRGSWSSSTRPNASSPHPAHEQTEAYITGRFG